MPTPGKNHLSQTNKEEIVDKDAYVQYKYKSSSYDHKLFDRTNSDFNKKKRERLNSINQQKFKEESINIDYVYLSNAERKSFAQSSREYFINNMQYNNTTVSISRNGDLCTNMSLKVNLPNLNFNHPCKELAWNTNNKESIYKTKELKKMFSNISPKNISLNCLHTNNIENDCVICLNILSDAVYKCITCNYAYHIDCILKMHSSLCPNCQTKICENNEVYNIESIKDIKKISNANDDNDNNDVKEIDDIIEIVI